MQALELFILIFIPVVFLYFVLKSYKNSLEQEPYVAKESIDELAEILRKYKEDNFEKEAEMQDFEDFVEGGFDCSGSCCGGCNKEPESEERLIDLNDPSTYALFEDAAEFERLIEGNFKIGDTFIDSRDILGNTIEDGVSCAVRTIVDFKAGKREWSYEYCCGANLENGNVWMIESAEDGVTMEEVCMGLEAGTISFVGTFDTEDKK